MGKAKLLDVTDIGQYESFWLGAYTDERHDSDHNQGTWYWPHRNVTVDWFDWLMVSQITKDIKNIVLYLLRNMTRFFPSPGTTFGMISIVILQHTIFVKNLAINNLFKYIF